MPEERPTQPRGNRHDRTVSCDFGTSSPQDLQFAAARLQSHGSGERASDAHRSMQTLSAT
jgi:hypothetical protein